MTRGLAIKTILRAWAWLGLLLIVIAMPLSFSSSDTWITTEQLGSAIGFMVAWLAGIAGTLLALVCGLITRPQYLWIATIITGSVYIVSFYGWIIKDLSPSILPILLPGILLIAEGIILRIFVMKYKSVKAAANVDAIDRD